jgi:anti-sigma B factor antagonist
VQPCEVEEARIGDIPAVIVRGEVDISAVDMLDAVLESAIRASAGAFVVDLAEVSFLDSSGLATIVRARALLDRHDRPLAVVCPPGPARRIFELTSMEELFAIFGSREEAADALVAAD